MLTEFTASEAVVFPGMGPSRFADVGKFMVINPYARRLVAKADERLGYSLVDAFRDTEGDYSRHAQVSFLVNCVALAQWAEGERSAVRSVQPSGSSVTRLDPTAMIGSIVKTSPSVSGWL